MWWGVRINWIYMIAKCIECQSIVLNQYFWKILRIWNFNKIAHICANIYIRKIIFCWFFANVGNYLLSFVIICFQILFHPFPLNVHSDGKNTMLYKLYITHWLYAIIEPRYWNLHWNILLGKECALVILLLFLPG